MGNESMAENLAVLVDEVVKAKAVVTPLGYAEGYYDGLCMALSILDGKVE